VEAQRRFTQRQVEEACVGRVKYAESVDTGVHLEIRPRFPVHEDGVAKVLRTPSGMNSCVIADVGKIDGPVCPELPVPEYERDFVLSVGEKLRQFVLRRSHKVQTRQTC